MAARMHFGVLGPLVITRDETVLPLARPKERALLAMLLLNAGRFVTVDELAEGLWDSAPPPAASATVRNHVKRLRQALGDHERSRIRTGAGGYRIDVEPGELDLTRFETLHATVREAAHQGMWPSVADYSGQALALWRGEPLAEAAGDPAWSMEAARLEEMRLQVAELAAEAELHLGRPAGVIPELKRLVAEYPLRENLHVLLMSALHEAGRDPEALSVYQEAQQLLLDELGTEPGAALRGLLRQILAGSAAADAGDAGRPHPDPPRQLPALGRHFTGRSAELATLTGLLNPPDARAPGTVAIAVIAGTPGVGKTALAVRWAHESAAAFPDGQLFVNLRGYDSGEPVRATDALAGFLRALGVPGRDIPGDETERAARYRSLLAGRRALVIVDNARDAGQVVPLLPGSATCAVLITSRDPLAGLVAREGAARLDLDLLPLEDAVRLLDALIGERVTASAGAARLIADGCARLPLALRVAGELATARPAVPLDELAAELLGHKRRLDLLDADGDPRTSVRSVISLSCQRLDDGTIRMLRLLGVYPGRDVGAGPAAALAGLTPAAAQTLLGQLARAYLVQPSAPDRYVMHDLLRAYGSELAAAGDPDEPPAALSRLIEYYVSTVRTAAKTAFPERTRFVETTANGQAMDPGAALAWLDTERENLIAGIEYAAASGWAAQAVAMAGPLFVYLEIGGHYPAAIRVCEYAFQVAKDGGELAGAATALSNLAIIAWRQSRFGDADGQFRQALTLSREAGDVAGQANALGNIGLVAFELGEYEDAVRHLRQARALYHQLGYRDLEALTLATMGKVAAHRGDYEQGIADLTQALAYYREAGPPLRQAEVLANLGSTALRMGRYPQAGQHLEQALIMLRESGHRHGEAHVLTDLGLVALHQENPGLAASRLRDAIALFTELGGPAGEAEARNGLGEVFLAGGEPVLAAAEHTAALDIAARIGDKFQLARAHQGLAAAGEAAGDRAGAEHHWREALALYSALGVPEAGHAQARLSVIAG